MSALVDFARPPIGAIHITNAGVRSRDIPTGNAGVAVDVQLAAPAREGSGWFERHG
jgi:hypothetical protein